MGGGGKKSDTDNEPPEKCTRFSCKTSPTALRVCIIFGNGIRCGEKKKKRAWKDAYSLRFQIFFLSSLSSLLRVEDATERVARRGCNAPARAQMQLARVPSLSEAILSEYTHTHVEEFWPTEESQRGGKMAPSH